MFIGYRLKLLRKQYNLSQIELGRMLGVSKVSVSNYEKGARIPSMETLLMILRVFNVSADYILGRELNVVCEDDGNFSVLLSSNDVNIIKQLRNKKELYNRISEDPNRFFDMVLKNNI